MGTRSVIAKAEGDGWVKGRYCHLDGYPSSQAIQLARIVEAKGSVDAALDVLLKHSWSSLDPDSMLSSQDDDRFSVYSGVGKSNDQGKDGADDEDWIFRNSDGWGTEWAYALSDAGLLVSSYKYSNQEWIVRGFWRWEDVLSADWDAL